MPCEFCGVADKFGAPKIKEYKYWTVYLNTNQSYLGWCTIRLNRHLEDFFDINEKELSEFFRITKKLRDAAKELFCPDMFNYATLGNTVHHVHLHFIPRYSRKVEFTGYVFEDARWKKNYAPYDIDLKIPPNTLTEIRNALADKLK